MKITYQWNLGDIEFKKDKGKVFSCFSCAGGSTMGYKLSGFDVIGNNEIDPKMMKVYRKNHNPKFSYLQDIRQFLKRIDIPDELFDLTILDGSPPCSSFSMAGSREEGWGKEKVFKEGQKLQVLDTLFFDFIEIANKLQPKIVVAENVKGLIIGNALKYVKEIYRQFEESGYYCNHFLLEGCKMGLPQRRERVFFIALRKDLSTPFLHQKDLYTISPKLNLNFREKEIPFKEVNEHFFNNGRKRISEREEKMWIESDKMGIYDKRIIGGKKIGFFHKCVNWRVAPTITAGGCFCVEETPEYLTDTEFIKLSSFPLDFDFCGEDIHYITGMSVPPIMMYKIAEQIKLQWIENF